MLQSLKPGIRFHYQFLRHRFLGLLRELSQLEVPKLLLLGNKRLLIRISKAITGIAILFIAAIPVMVMRFIARETLWEVLWVVIPTPMLGARVNLFGLFMLPVMLMRVRRAVLITVVVPRTASLVVTMTMLLLLVLSIPM